MKYEIFTFFTVSIKFMKLVRECLGGWSSAAELEENDGKWWFDRKLNSCFAVFEKDFLTVFILDNFSLKMTFFNSNFWLKMFDFELSFYRYAGSRDQSHFLGPYGPFLVMLGLISTNFWNETIYFFENLLFPAISKRP